ncbi:DUF3450 domain-containing protein [Solimonas terrae]|uniref:DUF3450 domain-containing protein n=1 Tax=Solimonas terrae TaxID=1396819 RepID=A0A6M2BNS1_9GAMM|nr:DUF3450 domain-containing protein [Solimonas terrae]NGY03709.1 DUF3450 domain-containing protein [Solimonas terrae]
MSRRLALAAIIVSSLAAPRAQAQNDALSKSLDTTQRAQQASVESQQRVDQLDDQTRALLERYRAASWQTQQLNVYAQQLNELLAQQTAQIASLRQQLADLDRAGEDLMPLMLRMTDSLDKFVALDLPFLHDERHERIENLKQALGDPQVNAGEKFRRILEAYQIEVDYGRTLGVERIDVAGNTMDVLRVGRVALYALAPDGSDPRIWNPQTGRWDALSRGAASSIRDGLKMAREMTAVNLLELPVAAAAGSTP